MACLSRSFIGNDIGFVITMLFFTNFKTDYVTAHRKTVDSGRPWDSPETEPMIPFDEHLKVPLDKVFD